jgi:HK97 family phage major capsid protein
MASMRDLLEARGRTVAAMRELTDNPAGDGDLSDEQVAAFDRHRHELERIEAAIRRQQLVDDAERRMAAPAIITSRGDGDYSTRAREFSICKAIVARLGEDVDAGFEREISAEVRRRSGRTFQGIAVPDEVFEKRVLTVGAAAADLYPVQHASGQFIDALRSALVVGRLGATVLSNLQGDVEIPRQTGSSSAQWVGEDGQLTATDATFDDVVLQPKTVGAISSYSRRTLINASPGIEQIVRNDLASVVASAIDREALLGDGASNRPTGVLNQTGVHSLTLAGPTWAQVLGFPAAIETADADVGSLAWVSNPTAVHKLRSTVKVTSTDSVMLMQEPGSLAGYPFLTTTAIPDLGSPGADTVLFGAWSQLLVGYWSGVDVLANPYEPDSFSRGRVAIRVMRDVDVAVRHGQSFAKAMDLPAVA